ncbi:CbiX/SirB N-terminal domain-containing protein [Comamonas faecalis]|uniref:CbiX/SirB N-terminal domain-containing protein n=1 Tax=Comamonas faecalis TaxID=1387849 RepID=A0ABP7QJG3_9BURK
MEQPAPQQPTAIVLFAHGSRDPLWARTLDDLQAALQQQAAAQGRPLAVVQAFLELMQPPLPQALHALAQQGHRHVGLLPVFWAEGSHVRRDLPALVAQAQQQHPGLQVQVWPVLSRWPGLLDWLAGQALARP